jgi:hypothetical protein
MLRFFKKYADTFRGSAGIVFGIEYCTAVMPKHVAANPARNQSRTTKYDRVDA